MPFRKARSSSPEGGGPPEEAPPASAPAPAAPGGSCCCSSSSSPGGKPSSCSSGSGRLQRTGGCVASCERDDATGQETQNTRERQRGQGKGLPPGKKVCLVRNALWRGICKTHTVTHCVSSASRHVEATPPHPFPRVLRVPPHPPPGVLVPVALPLLGQVAPRDVAPHGQLVHPRQDHQLLLLPRLARTRVCAPRRPGQPRSPCSARPRSAAAGSFPATRPRAQRHARALCYSLQQPV